MFVSCPGCLLKGSAENKKKHLFPQGTFASVKTGGTESWHFINVHLTGELRHLLPVKTFWQGGFRHGCQLSGGFFHF